MEAVTVEEPSPIEEETEDLPEEENAELVIVEEPQEEEPKTPTEDETEEEAVTVEEPSPIEEDSAEENQMEEVSEPEEVVMGLWDKLLNEGYEEIVHIPMSSGLSGSCQSALMLAQDYDGKVQVVNNQRISVTQRQSAMDAKALAENGYHADEIREKLEEDKFNSSIYIMLDTLYYLKKGGRITPAAAALGTILRLKPVLQIQGEKLDAFSKARGWKSAKKIMLDAMEKDIHERFAGEEVHLEAAYTGSEEEAQEWKAEIEARFPGYDVVMNPLSLSVSCHIGPGALAIAVSKVVDELA